MILTTVGVAFIISVWFLLLLCILSISDWLFENNKHGWHIVAMLFVIAFAVLPAVWAVIFVAEKLGWA